MEANLSRNLPELGSLMAHNGIAEFIEKGMTIHFIPNTCKKEKES